MNVVESGKDFFGLGDRERNDQNVFLAVGNCDETVYCRLSQHAERGSFLLKAQHTSKSNIQ
jgi:hypothetical protein